MQIIFCSQGSSFIRKIILVLANSRYIHNIQDTRIGNNLLMSVHTANINTMSSKNGRGYAWTICHDILDVDCHYSTSTPKLKVNTCYYHALCVGGRIGDDHDIHGSNSMYGKDGKGQMRIEMTTNFDVFFVLLFDNLLGMRANTWYNFVVQNVT